MGQAAILGLAFGAWASVFCLALTEPGEIFAFVGKFFLWVKRYSFSHSLIWAKVEKVAYLCPKCHAGQLSFWGYLLFSSSYYNPWGHFICVAIAVFIGWVSQELWKQRQK